MKRTITKHAAKTAKRRVKPGIFTETVLPILRAAKADGATAEVLVSAFLRALDSIYGIEAAGSTMVPMTLVDSWDPYEAGRRAVEALRKAEGGSISRQEAAKRLNIKLATLYDRIKAKEVVVWTDDAGRFRFPHWQFAGHGLLPGIKDCLKALDSSDYWAVMRFFLTPSESSGDMTPLALLRAGNIEAAVALAAGASIHAG